MKQGVEAVANPEPPKNDGGDCFACALCACLKHLYPEDPPSFEWTWELFAKDDDPDWADSTWTGMRKAIYNAQDRYEMLEVSTDLPEIRRDPDKHPYAFYAQRPTGLWARRLEAWLSAGWCALIGIHQRPEGPTTPEGNSYRMNHFVVADGVRFCYTAIRDDDGDEIGHKVTPYIHIVDSSKRARDYYWLPEVDLLKKHGAAAMRLLRRRELDERPEQPHYWLEDNNAG